MTHPTAHRLQEVDALRGLAALSVVAFHYTTQYGRVFGWPQQSPALQVPWGHLGVNLFFIVSGFVIFMTLARTRHAGDFIVSRFSRLFPAFWVAVVATHAVVQWLGLPGKALGTGQALANLTMVHGLFGVPHVDNVYWTLEVELLFYAGMLALFQLGRLHRLHGVLAALLLLRIAYHGAQDLMGLTLLPWRLYHLLILQYLPWFVLGICVHQALPGSGHAAALPAARRSAALALLSLALADGPALALLATALAALVWAAAAGRLPALRARPLVWLGAVSYPLYLLHENIGWAVLRRALAAGWNVHLAIAATTVLALVAAWALHRGVERPAMDAIRRRYRAHQARGAAPAAAATATGGPGNGA